jgi:predicted aspartyl protease
MPVATPSPRVALVLSAGFCFFLLAPLCFGEHNDDASLKSLYDGRRWFELRDSVAKGGASAFYQGVVACAFNDARRCEKKMGAIIRSHPKSDEAIEAHRRLASLYLTHGKYRAALAQVDAVLAIRTDDSDARDMRPLLATLSESPDQEVVRRTRTILEIHEDGLPFSIHGVEATYWFDTGANFSILSESEARRFGLRVRDVATKVSVSTGARVGLRIAIADELSIGSIRLKNVEFLVFPDDQPPFNQQTPGSRGLIGIPVLLAFERFVWTADKKFEIGSKPASRNSPRANLCFDGNTPVTQLQFNNGDLAFVLDTGATNTDLFPPFAKAFPELIRDAEKTDAYKMEGVGSVKNMNAATIESVRLVIGGLSVVLKPANVLLEPTGETSKFFEGNLGIDLLQQAHKTTFDFKAMTLTLE